MSNFNFLVVLQSYSDQNSTNNPSLSNIRWSRSLNGLPVSNPVSQAFSLAPGETKTIFNGTRTLLQDSTTLYSISLKPLTSNTYVLSNTGGTAPNFRTPRSTGADATTQVSVTVNGPVLTFTSTGGTLFNFTTVQVGDFVRLGSQFNVANQGEYKILAFTTTSFSVENETGVVEGPITLGSSFASQVQIYSALGVQIGDTLKITGGFSPVSRQSYQITSVSANSLEFYSTDVLPQESNIMTEAIAIYSDAMQLVYLEADQNCSMTINGVSGDEIEPFVINNSVSPGVFLRKSTIYSMSVTNSSTNTANLFMAAVE